MKSAILGTAVLAAIANAQSGPWGQCGGNNWTGPTTCVAGWTCVYNHEWYSQCLPASSSSTTTTARSTTTTSRSSSTASRTTSTTTARITTTLSTTTRSTTTITTTTRTTTTTSAAATGLIWLGVNESGAEFGETVLPGLYGTHYIFPDPAAIDTLVSQGYNIFRVAFRMERLAQNGITGAFHQGYLANLTATVNHITSRGAWAVLDPHNYGRFGGSIITDTNAFGTWWTNLANAFKSNSKVIFDTNNEYHTMDQTLVLNLNQAAINAIRATGATSQYIFVEGNQWSGAWSWTNVNDNMKALTDPQNKLVYEMHQYLDSDSSGTSATCVSTTIGVERVTAATQWLRANGKIGVLGEFAGGANPTCQAAVKGLLDYLKANSDVWKGALWWGGGPWWGNYIFNFEPPSGQGYTYYNQLLLNYKP